MKQKCRSTGGAWSHTSVMLVLAPALLLSDARAAIASDGAMEREQLCALVRQIELTERLAEHAAKTALNERARYHFDYALLRADLKRVRAGLQDYLVPQRAQPRDLVPLAGDYVRRDEQ